MLVSFLLPYEARYSQALYLWIFYKQLNHFKDNQIVYIGNKNYFIAPSLLQRNYPDKVELLEQQQYLLGYSIPSDEQVKTAKKYIIDATIFEDLEAKLITNHQTWKFLLTNRYSALEFELNKALTHIEQQYGPIEGILNWCNIPSLNFLGKQKNIPVIHNEVGPLRKPFYQQVAYFDFSGVGGNTESALRFKNFQKEKLDGNKEVPILSRQELLLMFSKPEYHPMFLDKDSSQYDIGIPLQVEDDSNILAFNNGWTNMELIKYTYSKLSQNILIRKHPGGHLDYDKVCPNKMDDSISAIEFIKKCKKIITINSSTAFEAVLLGKRIQVLGDSSFNLFMGIDLDSKEMLFRLNFFLFGYLIPYRLLFDYDYLQWRLTRPTEIEIYMYHFNYWIKQGRLYCDKQNVNLVYKKIYTELYSTKSSEFSKTFMGLKGQGDFDVRFDIKELCLNKDNSDIMWEVPNEKLCKVKITEVSSDGKVLRLLPLERWSHENDFDFFVSSAPRYIICGDFCKASYLAIKGEWQYLSSSELLYLADKLKWKPVYFSLVGLLKNIQKKKVVIFGTGSLSKKIAKYFPAVEYFLDNNSDKWGKTIDEITIKPPQALLQEDEQSLAIVIASQYYTEIATQLIHMGFIPNKHFWNGYELFSTEV